MKAKRILTDREAALPALAEAFRQHGFEGASLSVLSKATGLGKGSLYNFFPGGKEEMMEAVLSDVERWFADAIFAPLEQDEDPANAIFAMFERVTTYFQSGRRVCIVGGLGLNTAGNSFAAVVRQYFSRWIAALAQCLERGKIPPTRAKFLAETTVSGIQGAIVLSRALGETAAFERIATNLRSSLLGEIERHG